MEFSNADRSVSRTSPGDTADNVPSRTGRPSSSYRHAIQEAMAVLNGQWVVAVLASLAARPMKYLDLLADINSTEERLGWTLASPAGQPESIELNPQTDAT